MTTITPAGYVPVAGTHAERRGEYEWHRPHSPFDAYLRAHGYERRASEFGFWSTALAGTFFCGSSHLAWQYGGAQLWHYLRDLPMGDRLVIAHSHGGAVVAYALARRPRVRVRGLITIDTPVRRDMRDVWAAGAGAAEIHIHLYGTGFGSLMRWLGQRGRFTRRMPGASENVRIAGGHSGILREARHMPQILLALRRIEAAAAHHPPLTDRRGVGTP